MFRLLMTVVVLLLASCGGEQPDSNDTGVKPTAKTFKWRMVTTWPKNLPGMGLAPELLLKNR